MSETAMTLSFGGDVEPSDKPFWAKCGKCAHCWVAAYLPMDISKLVRITKRCCCPRCGDRKPVLAKQNDGVLLELANAPAPIPPTTDGEGR